MATVELSAPAAAPLLVEAIPSGHAELYDLFTAEEMSLIVQLKRFRELLEGDKCFRDSVDKGRFAPETLEFLRRVGITFPMEEVSLFWKNAEAVGELRQVIGGWATFEELSAKTRALVEGYPLLMLFARYSYVRSRMYRHHDEWARSAGTLAPEYDAWRKRRIAATKSELGSYGSSIDHPVLAIELCVGCSVGCSFCAFDAPRLTSVFDYNSRENRQLFRAVSESLYKVLGPAAGRCLLYWSTEPHDNPHYIDFMREYQKVTGSKVCTSTARWSEDWIRSLIDFYRPTASPWPRISVLSRKIMHRLFEQFTPDEFRDVWLLPQQKDGEDLRKKVPGGREKMMKILLTSKDQRDYHEDETPEEEVLQGSIACVSGFLVNLIEKKIQLNSPCYTSEKYRYGYRVFAEATFETAEDFDHAIRDIMARKMLLQPYRTMPVRFRDDLDYRPKEAGFVLVSPFKVHRFEGNETLGPVGRLIAGGDLNHEQVIQRLVREEGINPMMASATIKGLFDRGFLDEVDVDKPPSVH